jgi:hypothetical protein
MRARALVLLPLIGALPLGGCVVAAVPVVAGAAIARSEAQRAKRKAAATVAPAPTPAPTTAPEVRVTVGEPGSAAPPVAVEFAPLVDHVRSRATLWREGAPIKSLVLDDRQSVLNPIAIDCQRRQPVVLIDLDPAAARTLPPVETMLAAPGWTGALAAIRDLDVGIVWITARMQSEARSVQSRLTATGLDPWSRDTVATTPSARGRKQDVRLEQARRHCVLAVVGDKRGDADEAYDYLRSPNAVLPIDDNWGAGWFLLPSPLETKDSAR